MEYTWYHGSPIKFDKFEFDHPTSSRLGDGKSIHLTKCFNLARSYAKSKKNINGFVYIVKVDKQHTGRYWKMFTVDTYFTDKSDFIECLQIYNTGEIEIIECKEVII